MILGATGRRGDLTRFVWFGFLARAVTRGLAAGDFGRAALAVRAAGFFFAGDRLAGAGRWLREALAFGAVSFSADTTVATVASAGAAAAGTGGGASGTGSVGEGRGDVTSGLTLASSGMR
jgi:hypothetical protein